MSDIYKIKVTVVVSDDSNSVGTEIDEYEMEDSSGDMPPALPVARYLVEKAYHAASTLFDGGDPDGMDSLLMDNYKKKGVTE